MRVQLQSHFAPGKGSQDEELRRDALSAKRSLLLDGVWDAVTRAVGSVPAASKLPTRCVYIGGYKGLCDKRMKEILERDCGRMEAFEWHEGWSFARWAREEAAEKALMARWKAGARGPALVVLPAPDGKIVRGGLLLEMSRGQGTCSRIARKV